MFWKFTSLRQHNKSIVRRLKSEVAEKLPFPHQMLHALPTWLKVAQARETPAPDCFPPPHLADCMMYPALRQRGLPFNSYAFVLEPRPFKFPFLHFVIGFYSAFF